ncbi:unnamed protein product [Blepharisma stoltei]|uniref:Protein kinase domain-containing protein n=1 Tax=Blepharisma stoltei TaxID=1481888 RepID=A0AAU9IKM7_9CILI|nr:unnamed protein product [Blepharisma stoltei]
MGGKTSIFSICKGIPKRKKSKKKSTQNTPLLIANALGPTEDNIENPKGYLYFSKKEQKYYDSLLVKEEKTPGEIIAPTNWQTSEMLGQGSFGRVLFGANMDTGELMAVKQIPIVGFEYETANERIKEIQEEVDILSQLKHKNIVRYLGTERNDQFLHIFLEYIPGGSIASLLAKYGKFNETLIRVYTKQILEGLEYLHYHKIIHRDIKGANVLVGSDGVCKLADFGASKRIIGLCDQTQFKSLRGTVNWMAPEVMKEEGHGRFADVWSLGCLVVEMATGKPPWFYKTNPIAVFMHVCSTNNPPELPEELSEECKDFVKECFQRDPSKRANVYKLLRHPFIVGTTQYPLYMGPSKTDDFLSNSTKFSSDDNKVAAFLSGSLAESVLNEEIKIKEKPTDEGNLDYCDPHHNVKAPFDSIITISKFIPLAKEENEEIILRRPSDSGSSEESKIFNNNSEVCRAELSSSITVKIHTVRVE